MRRSTKRRPIKRKNAVDAVDVVVADVETVMKATAEARGPRLLLSLGTK